MIGYSAMSYGDLITATFLLFCECCVLWFWSIDNSNFFILLQIKDFWWLMLLSLTSYLRNSLASVGWRQITIISNIFCFCIFGMLMSQRCWVKAVLSHQQTFLRMCVVCLRIVEMRLGCRTAFYLIHWAHPCVYALISND